MASDGLTCPRVHCQNFAVVERPAVVRCQNTVERARRADDLIEDHMISSRITRR
jgi:hypothetical protein